MIASSVRAPQLDKQKGRTVAVRPFQNSQHFSNTADSKSTLRLQRLSALGIFGDRANVIAGIVWGVANG